jgi:hypothetical protein
MIDAGTRLPRLLLPLPPVALRVVAVGYVLLDAVLGALAFSSDASHPKVEVAAFLLALPMVVVTIPVIYVVGAMAWNVRSGLAGEPMWPVTVTFTALFTATALLNVLLAWLAWSRLRRGR